jgi:hypothetical protein
MPASAVERVRIYKTTVVAIDLNAETPWPSPSSPPSRYIIMPIGPTMISSAVFFCSALSAA